MTQKTSAPVEGLIFDNNESVNAVDANSTVTNNEPVFAVTKGSIGTAVGWTGSQIAEALADPKLHGIVKEVRGETDKEKQKQLKEQKKFDIIGICPHFASFRNDHRAAAESELCAEQGTQNGREGSGAERSTNGSPAKGNPLFLREPVAHQRCRGDQTESIGREIDHGECNEECHRCFAESEYGKDYACDDE
jgi:hypothetical protein